MGYAGLDWVEIFYFLVGWFRLRWVHYSKSTKNLKGLRDLTVGWVGSVS